MRVSLSEIVEDRIPVLTCCFFLFDLLVSFIAWIGLHVGVSGSRSRDCNLLAVSLLLGYWRVIFDFFGLDLVSLLASLLIHLRVKFMLLTFLFMRWFLRQGWSGLGFVLSDIVF